MSAGVARVCSECSDEVHGDEQFCTNCGGDEIERACDACGVILGASELSCRNCNPPDEATLDATLDATLASTLATGSASGLAISEQDALETAVREELVDEFRITGVLNSTTRATVFLADDLTRERVVTITVFPPWRLIDGAADAAHLAETVLAEAQRLIRAKHPHLCDVYAVRQLDDVFLLIGQYVPGRTLAELLRERNAAGERLSLESVRQIAQHVGAALDFAHGQDIAHGAVRSDNIVLGDDGFARLGNAAFSVDAPEHRPAEAAPYLSLQQQCGERATSADDQFALGVVLYECLTGLVPLDAQPIDAPEAITRMLAEDPRDRFSSIADAIAAFDANDDVSADASVLTEQPEAEPAAIVSPLPTFTDDMFDINAIEVVNEVADAPVVAVVDSVAIAPPPPVAHAAPASPVRTPAPVVRMAPRPATEVTVSAAPSRAVRTATTRPAAPQPATTSSGVGRKLALLALVALAAAAGAYQQGLIALPSERTASAPQLAPSTLFDEETQSAVAAAGFTFTNTGLHETFDQSLKDAKLLVVQGRVSLAPTVQGYGRANWHAASGDLAVRLDFWFDALADARQGGVILRDGRGQHYFVQVQSSGTRGIALTMRGGRGDRVLVPLTNGDALRAGANALELFATAGRLTAVLNGTVVIKAFALPTTPDGQIGLFGGAASGIEFDNLAIVNLTRP